MFSEISRRSVELLILEYYARYFPHYCRKIDQTVLPHSCKLEGMLLPYSCKVEQKSIALYLQDKKNAIAL